MTTTNNAFTILDDLLQDGLSTVYQQTKRISFPPINIIETDTNYIIEVIAAGFNKSELFLNVEQSVLILSGKITEKPNLKMLKKEYEIKSFERKFNLPKTVEITNISAEHKNGILSITIPKLPEVVSKGNINIAIK